MGIGQADSPIIFVLYGQETGIRSLHIPYNLSARFLDHEVVPPKFLKSFSQAHDLQFYGKDGD